MCNVLQCVKCSVYVENADSKRNDGSSAKSEKLRVFCFRLCVCVFCLSQLVELAHEGDGQGLHDSEEQGAPDGFAVGGGGAGVPEKIGTDEPSGVQEAAGEKWRQICEWAGAADKRERVEGKPRIIPACVCAHLISFHHLVVMSGSKLCQRPRITPSN